MMHAAYAMRLILSQIATGAEPMTCLERLCAQDRVLRLHAHQTRTLCRELEFDGHLIWKRGVVTITDRGMAKLADLQP